MFDIILVWLGVLALSGCLLFFFWFLLLNWWLIVQRLRCNGKNGSPVFCVPQLLLLLAAVVCDTCFSKMSWAKCVLMTLAGIDLIAEVFHLLYKDRKRATGKSGVMAESEKDENE